MIIHDIDQNSDEWYKIRAGKFTASGIPKLFMGKSTKGYNDYLNEIVFGRLTGECPESFESYWMRRGHEFEHYAIESYELRSFQKVDTVGFIEASPITGCSPDGLINDDGMIQIKCVKHTTLIDYLLAESIPKDYLIQMQAEMLFAERKYNVFFAWHPNLKPFEKVVRVDEGIVGNIISEIKIAEEFVQERVNKLK